MLKPFIYQISNLAVTLISSFCIPILIAHEMGIHPLKIWIISTALAGILSVLNINSSSVISNFLYDSDEYINEKMKFILKIYLFYVLATIFITCLVSTILIRYFLSDSFSDGTYLTISLVLLNSINSCIEPFSGKSLSEGNFEKYLKKQLNFRILDTVFMIIFIAKFSNFNFIAILIPIKLLLLYLVFSQDFKKVHLISIKQEFRLIEIFDANKEAIYANFRISLTNWMKFQFFNLFTSQIVTASLLGSISLLRTLNSGLRQVTETILGSFNQEILHSKNASPSNEFKHRMRLMMVGVIGVALIGNITLFFCAQNLPKLLGLGIRLSPLTIFLMLGLSFIEIVSGFLVNYLAYSNSHFLISKFRFFVVFVGSILSGFFGLIYGLHIYLYLQIIYELIFLILYMSIFFRNARND